MRFIRLATFYFSPSPSGWDSFEVSMNGVTAQPLRIGNAPVAEGKLQILMKAEVTLSSLPEKRSDGCLIVPAEPRRRCEEVLETIANLIAVGGRCERIVSSPTPSAALVAENTEEGSFLEAARGVQVVRFERREARFQIELSSALLNGLTDRMDGVTLLAEAFSHKRSSGKYREFVRLFERAFALPTHDLQKKLWQFLRSADLGYTSDEVRRWLELRDGITHADLRKTTTTILDSDVLPIIGRMEQAAVDALFNKTSWHDPSRDRRALLKPPAATMSESGALKVVPGSVCTIRGQIFDDFGAYPRDLQVVIPSPPSEWWWKPFNEPEPQA